MARSLHRDQSISQKNNASCIGNKRGMARRAKRNSNKADRQFLQKDLENKINGIEEDIMEEEFDSYLLEMEMEYGDETEELGLEFLELNPQLRK